MTKRNVESNNSTFHQWCASLFVIYLIYFLLGKKQSFVLKCTLLGPTIQIDIIDAKAMQRTVFNLLFSIQSIDVFVIVSAVVFSIWLIIYELLCSIRLLTSISSPGFFFLCEKVIIYMHCHKMLKTDDWRPKTEDWRVPRNFRFIICLDPFSGIVFETNRNSSEP